jgi:hypothetical protein
MEIPAMVLVLVANLTQVVTPEAILVETTVEEVTTAVLATWNKLRLTVSPKYTGVTVPLNQLQKERR